MTFVNSNDENCVAIRVYAQTDVGMVRQGNEDNFLAVDLSTAVTWTADHPTPPEELLTFKQGRYGALFAVSDGMGGALAGEVASQLAVTAVRDWMLQFQANPAFQPFPFHERLRLSVEQANLLINSKSQNHAEYAGMGATFTGAGVDDTTLYLAQIGDSRAYLIRRGAIVQMTKDQSLVSQLVEAGHITEEEAESHHYKNVILQALGATQSVIVVVDKVQLRHDDIVLLCSDGLSGKVRGPEMLNILNESNGDLTAACNKLVQTANERGGEDNITVMLLHFTGGPLSSVEEEEKFESLLIQRDPKLPDEIDPGLLISEEPTLSPEDRATFSVPTTTAVLSASAVAGLLEAAGMSSRPPSATPPPPIPPLPAERPQPPRRNFSLIAAGLVVVSLVLAAVYFALQAQKPTPTSESPPKPTPQQVKTPPADQPPPSNPNRSEDRPNTPPEQKPDAPK